MALQKTLTIEKLGGLEVTDAYISVANPSVQYKSVAEENEDGSVTVKTKKWVMRAPVLIHKSRETKLLGYSPIATHNFEGEFPADQQVNPLIWMYEQLKQTDEYSGAEDVIE